MKCIGNPVVRMDGRTDVRSRDYYVTTNWKFLGLIGYQISLAMELRWHASALAPLIYFVPWGEGEQWQGVMPLELFLFFS